MKEEVNVDIPTKTCSACKEVKPSYEFWKNSSHCKRCRRNPPEGRKYCSKCNELKPLDNFHKTKRHKDGHNYCCKKCVNKYYVNNKNKMKIYYKL